MKNTFDRKYFEKYITSARTCIDLSVFNEIFLSYIFQVTVRRLQQLHLHRLNLITANNK